MAAKRKRIGRPTKKPKPGTRVSLGLKVTPEIKNKLDKAARANGRTQSQEAEARLERSFEREGLLPEVLTLAYGPTSTLSFLEAYNNGMLRVRDKDKAHMRRCFDAFLEALQKGEIKP